MAMTMVSTGLLVAVVLLLATRTAATAEQARPTPMCEPSETTQWLGVGCDDHTRLCQMAQTTLQRLLGALPQRHADATPLQMVLHHYCDQAPHQERRGKEAEEGGIVDVMSARKEEHGDHPQQQQERLERQHTNVKRQHRGAPLSHSSPPSSSPSSSSSSSSVSETLPWLSALHKRKRRDEPSTTAPVTTTATVSPSPPTDTITACTVSSMIFGNCSVAMMPYTVLVLSFDAVDDDTPLLATLGALPASAENRIAELSTAIQPSSLVLNGFVHEVDLDWVLQAGVWDTVSSISMRGLTSPFLHLNILNPLPNLTSIHLADSSTIRVAQHYDNSTISMGNVGVSHTAIINNLQPTREHGAFHRAPYITHFTATDTRIRELHASAFARMSRLKELRLAFNQLTVLAADTFADLAALEILDIAANHISSIDESAFAGLSSLHTLNMSRNDMTQLAPGLLRGVSALKHLDMGVNFVATIPASLFSDQQQLEWLAMTFNLATSLPEGLFATTAQLREAYLRHSRLEHLPPRIFRHLPHLRILSLQNNRLTQLRVDWFAEAMPELRELLALQNRITSLPPDLLRRLPNLDNLSVQQNRITSIPPTLLRDHANLGVLDMSHNQIAHVPESALRALPSLRHLSLAHNQLTSFPRRSLPSLRTLRLNSNPIAASLDPAGMPQLLSVYANDHRVQRIDITPFLNLTSLHRLEMSPAAGVVGARVVFDRAFLADSNASSRITGTLKQADLRNVDVRALLEAFASSGLRLRGLYLGWPGMNEQTLPSKRLCHILHVQVESIALRNTGYKVLDLCPEHDFSVVFMQDNPLLESVTLYSNTQQLNVSGCPELKHLAVPSVDILDISKTQLPPARGLCRDWGRSAVLARDWQNTEVRSVSRTQTLLSQCLTFSHVGLLDLSDNAWLNNPSVLEVAVSELVAVSTEDLNTNQFIRLRSRPSVPILQLTNGPVVCQLKVQDVRTRVVGRPEVQDYNLAYYHRCRCAVGYTTRDGRCQRKQLNATPVVLGTLGGVLVLQAALYVLYRWYRKHAQLRQENELNMQLLSEKDAEVLALKAAWEISFDELDLKEHVASGAYGDVWEAEWDTVHVAVKVMKQTEFSFDDTTQREFEKEVDFLQRTRHQNLVRFFGAGTDPVSNTPFLVLEFVALGSLRELLAGDLAHVLETYGSEDLSLTTAAGAGGVRGGGAQGSRRQRTEREKPDDSEREGQLVEPVAPGAQDEAEAANNEQSGPQGQESRTCWKMVAEKGDGDNVTARVWRLKVLLIQDVARGMAFIHSLGQLHRDLKSGNVLVSSHLRAKITDFGTITQRLGAAGRKHTRGNVRNNDGNRGTAQGIATSRMGDLPYTAGGGAATMSVNLTIGVGTPLYMAPEALMGSKYDAHADVFSFGVLMWEIATQQPPDLIAQEKGPTYKGPLLATLYNLIQEGKRLRFPQGHGGSRDSGSHNTGENAGVGTAAPVARGHGLGFVLDADKHVAVPPSWYQKLALQCMAQLPHDRPLFGDIQQWIKQHHS